MKPFFTRRPSPADFIDLLKFSPEEQALSWLRKALPKWALQIHEDDLERVVRGLSDAGYQIWDISNSPTASLKFSKHIDSLLEPSARLLEVFEHPNFEIFESLFAHQWKISMDVARAGETKEAFTLSREDEAFRSQAWKDFDQLRMGIAAIKRAVDLNKRVHAAKYGTHKPRDDRRYEMARAILSAWISMRLLVGASLKDAVPTGRNGGFRWCYEALEALHKCFTVPPAVPHIDWEDLNTESEPLSPKLNEAIGDGKGFRFDDPESISEIVSERRDEMDIRTWSEESFQVMLRESIVELKTLSEEDFRIAQTDWRDIYLKDRLGFYIVSSSLDVVFSDELLDDGFPLEDLLERE